MTILISGTITGPAARPHFRACDPYCCRCGAVDGRELLPVRAACGCEPAFCEECRTNMEHPFAKWIEGYAKCCRIKPAYEHIDYAKCWQKGIEPIVVREERDGSLDVCSCGHERKWHNSAYTSDGPNPKYWCSLCGAERCREFHWAL